MVVDEGKADARTRGSVGHESSGSSQNGALSCAL